MATGYRCEVTPAQFPNRQCPYAPGSFQSLDAAGLEFQAVPTNRVSVVVADRDPLVLYALDSILRAASKFKIVAACRDATTCIESISNLCPDLALLEISLPPAGGLQVLASINSKHCKKHFDTRVVFLSASLNGSAEATAVARGAFGIIPRDATPNLMVRGLRKIAAGDGLLPIAAWDPELRNCHRHRPPDASGTLSAALTESEGQILCLVGEGLSNKEIGRQLNLSDGTVKVHLHRIYQKLAIRNHTALALMAKRDGMSEP